MGYWKHAVVALTLGQACLSQGQSTFNRRYDTFDSLYAQTGWSVELLTSGGALAFHTSDWVDSVYAYGAVVSVLQLDAAGELLAAYRVEHFAHATYPGWSNGSFPLTNGGYAIGGSSSAQDGTKRPVLYFFDAEGMPTGFIEYGAIGEEWIGRQGKQTPDGGYVICGETSATASVDAFVLKIAPDGQQEWVRTYGIPSGADYVMTIDLAPGGGYYLGGQQLVAPDDYDQWVFRIDGDGGLVWEGTYGTQYDDVPNAHLVGLTDGACVFASAWSVSAFTRRLCMVKIDPSGEVVWSRMYGTAGTTTLFGVQEIEPGGDLIAVGQRTTGFPDAGILLRTTNAGDSLWMRTYVYSDEFVSNGQGTLRDVQTTPDGGFIAVGTAYAGAGFSQDVWVIKVDSLGCIEPGCHLIMGIESQITNLRDALTVAPNPVAGGGMVQVSLKLPESFTPQGALRLTVTDATGRMVHDLQLSSPAGQLTTDNWLNLQLPTGLYHLHLHDATRWISGAKLVVE